MYEIPPGSSTITARPRISRDSFDLAARRSSSSSSSSRSSDSSSSASSSSSGSPSVSVSTKPSTLSPACVKAANSASYRKPSPLKKQMSLGDAAVVVPLNVATQSQSGGFVVDPLRSHTAGPLAVLYTIEPEHDPLLVPASTTTSASAAAATATGSPSRSPVRSKRSSLSSSPSVAHHALHDASTSRSPPHNSINLLASGSVIPPSPSRSLLSAFQAASPRSQPAVQRPASAPLPSAQSASINDTHEFVSPRPIQSMNAASATSTALAPASPIVSKSPRHARKASFATAAFRALNGAVSPQRQVPSRSSSAGSNDSIGLSRTNGNSPFASGSNISSLNSGDAPAWQIYRDPVPAQSARPQAVATTSVTEAALNDQDNIDEMQEDFDENENENENQNENENDENVNIAFSHAGTHQVGYTLSASLPTSVQRRCISAPSSQHRLQLNTDGNQSCTGNERESTPPPDASCLYRAETSSPLGAPQSSSHSRSLCASAQRARKRLRTAGQ